jgi:hypothetical protein
MALLSSKPRRSGRENALILGDASMPAPAGQLADPWHIGEFEGLIHFVWPPRGPQIRPQGSSGDPRVYLVRRRH